MYDAWSRRGFLTGLAAAPWAGALRRSAAPPVEEGVYERIGVFVYDHAVRGAGVEVVEVL